MHRRLRASLVLCSLATGLLAADARAASLTVLVTIDPRIPAVARDALMAEASRIWNDAGVRLEWMSSAASSASSTPTLRLLAMPWRGRHVDGEATVLGELIRVGESKAVAIVSVDEAAAIADRISPQNGVSRDERLGLILGRAAAHEIGHFVLNMSRHADNGLMRPRFSDREFADPDSTAFQLDLLQVASN